MEHKKASYHDKKVVRLSKLFAVCGGIEILVIGILFFISVLKREPLIPQLISVLLLFLGLLCILLGLVWRITYDTEQIIVRNCLGIRRTFSYEELTACSGGKKDKVLYFGRRKVRIDGLCIGGKEFFDFAKKQYRMRHAGNALPIHKDVFHGKLENPGEFIFVFVLMYLLCAVFPIIVIHEDWLIPTYTESMLNWESLPLVSAAWSDDTLILYTEDSNYSYEIPDAESNISGLDALLRKIPGNASRILQTESNNSDVEAPVFQVGFRPDYGSNIVYVLTDVESQITYVSLTQMNTYFMKQNILYLCLSFIPAVVWTLFILAFFYVVHHANQLPKQIVRLFVKDGYLIDSESVKYRNNHSPKKRKKR